MNKKEYMNKTIDKIENQIGNVKNNNEDVRSIAEASSYQSRKAINFEGTSYGADQKAEPENKPYPETDRFCKNLDINEADIRANKKMKLHQSTDAI